MVSAILLIGLATAVFVGVNIGGSSTGVAFGPATGSGVLSMRQASALMGVFVLIGGITVGTNVVHTLGSEFVPPEYFTVLASIGVLLFTGLSILLGNLVKVSVSTSETAVGAVVGMGAALGVLNWETVGVVVMWWFVSPLIAFWVSGFVGRYLYDDLVGRLDLEGRFGFASKLLVIGIGCYMAFSAGASNVANAVAPLVGSGALEMTPGVLLGGAAIAVGAFVLGPRTMETIGEEITDLSLEASLVVELLAASIITALSWGGIPASLAVTTTACVIGLGWGRASRRIPLEATVRPEGLTAGERETWREDQLELYDPQTTKRVVSMWFATPLLAGIAAYAVFEVASRLAAL